MAHYPNGAGEKVRILLATEEPMLALGAKCLLASAGDFEVTSNPKTHAELARVAVQEQPDLLLLDAAPDFTPALLAIVRQAAPQCRIVLWARSITEELADQAVQLGVAGFVRRTASNEQFIEQLRRIARGHRDFDRAEPLGAPWGTAHTC